MIEITIHTPESLAITCIRWGSNLQVPCHDFWTTMIIKPIIKIWYAFFNSFISIMVQKTVSSFLVTFVSISHILLFDKTSFLSLSPSRNLTLSYCLKSYSLAIFSSIRLCNLLTRAMFIDISPIKLFLHDYPKRIYKKLNKTLQQAEWKKNWVKTV